MDQFFKLGSTFTMNLFSYGIIALIAGITLFSFLTKKNKRPKFVSFFLCALIFFMIWLLIIVPSNAGITIENDELKINIPLSAEITVARKDVASCKVVDWNQDTDYKPLLRTFGTSLGDYRIGNFKLKNGKSAKLLAIGEKAVVIELKNENHLLVLAPKDFDGFVKVIDENFVKVIN